MAANPDTWKTLAQFDYLQDSFVLKSRLEDEGIEVFVLEEFTSSIIPVMTGFQVNLQVKSVDFEVAKSIYLDQLQTLPKDVCPKCESENIVKKEAALNKNWFTAILGLVFLIPVRTARHKWECQNCGHLF
jgi:hypothetical protein